MKLITLLIITFALTACTYTISLVHTEGNASNVGDDTDTPSTSIAPSLTIPAKAL